MVPMLVLALLLWRLNMHQSVLFRELDNVQAQIVHKIHLKRMENGEEVVRVCVCKAYSYRASVKSEASE